MTVWMRRAMTVTGLMASGWLTGCGNVGDNFPPPCPQAAILGDAADLQRFRGGGRDFLDTALQGRIVKIDGACKQDGRRVVVTTVSVGLELTRGPAAAGRQVSVPYFVAVSRGDRVLDKQVYNAAVSFPENTDRVAFTGDPVELRLPVSDQVGADAYRVTVGFQLTADELAWNRRPRR